MQPMMDPAEYRSLIMMGRRTKVMAFYAVMFGFAITLLKNPDDMDAFSAVCVVAFYWLISCYYLITQNRFFAPLFKEVSDAIVDDKRRVRLQRENAFRRIAHGLFILLSFIFIAYLGIYHG